MVTPSGLRPARLKVGIISGGRVGTAIGAALERAEHVVVACSAISATSRRLTERRLPDTPVLPVPDVADHAELLVLTVPDSELAGIVVAVDRQERGAGDLSAVDEVRRDLGVPVEAIVTFDHVIEFLEESGRHAEHLDAARAYRDQYGA